MRPLKKLTYFDFSWIVLTIGFLVMQVSTFLNVDILYAQDMEISRSLYVLFSSTALIFIIIFFYMIPTLLVLETIDLFIHILPSRPYKTTSVKKQYQIKNVIVEKLFIKHAVYRC